MDVSSRVRADWSRPAVPIGRDLFLVAAAPVIVVMAQVTRPGSPASLAGLATAAAVLVVLGLGIRVPLELAAAWVIVAVTAVVGLTGDLETALFLPVLMTLYTSWHLGSTIRAALVMLPAVASPVLVAEVLTPESNLLWAPWVAANAFMFAMGLTLRRQRDLIDELHAAREALADQAVAEERRRIARELHDLAGHTLAAMMLHVTGARHVLERDRGDARQALADAEEVGRASLDQIRATVAALRTDERGTDPALASPADLPDLVDAYRRAGLRIDARVDPAATELTGPVGTAVHRIVQEALANVARHAAGNRVVVDVRVVHDEVLLDVTDHGDRPAPTADGGAPGGPGGAHFGVVGMRERTRAVGGDLSAGPHDHGWQVRARLPLVVEVP